ncbi:MAG: amidohydrolase family protein [bacterium]
MKGIAVTGARVVLPDRVAEDVTVHVRGDRITSLAAGADRGEKIMDAKGKYLLPGLIDIHTHGRAALPDPENLPSLLKEDSEDLARTGVSRYLVTFASAPVPVWLSALDSVSSRRKLETPAARPLGVHLEGVFINPAAAGAQPPDWIKPFNRQDRDHLRVFRDYSDLVRMITFAPEIEGSRDLLRECQEHGVVPAMGHTAAEPELVHEFARLGAHHMVHIMNGMKVFHHRDPGPAAAGLVDDRISVEIICDGYHLHPETIRMVHGLKHLARRVLITDSVTMDLPGMEKGGPDEPNRMPGGGFAGSRLRLCRGVKNYMDYTGCGLAEAAAMASLNPARVLGIDAEFGSLRPGNKADFYICGDDLVPETMFIDGERIF